MRVLVTGGSGRLGRSVVQVLAERGHEVVSVDAAEGSAAVREHVIDCADPGALASVIAAERPEAVVALAAIAVPFSAPEAVILRQNVALVSALLEATMRDGGVRTVIAASSPTVLGYGAPHGWLPERLPLDEEEPRRPWNAYALSKLVVEEAMRSAGRSVGDRMRFVSFRPCYVIAPEEWRGAPTQQGHTVAERLADPDLSAPALFNYVDARDAAAFLDLAVQAGPELPQGDTFFVGAADALATRPLAELLPRYVPGTEELAAGLTGTAPAFSFAKAERVLGWRPQRSWRTELADSEQGDVQQGTEGAA